MANVDQVLSFFNTYDRANRGFINSSDLSSLLRDLGMSSSMTSAQRQFQGNQIDKFDFIGWWNKEKTRATAQGGDQAATAEAIFVQMLGSADAEANIKQFATAVEKLGYDWDASLLRGVFERIDNSGDGMVDLQEFQTGIQMVGGAQMFKEMDADNSGTIELNEFVNACRATNPKFRESKAREVFASVDVDDSGKLDLLEFLDAINAMARGEAGGFGSLGFKDKLAEEMGNLKKKLAEAEKRMNGLAAGLGAKAAAKDAAQNAYGAANSARRNKQAELDKIAAQMAPQAAKLESMKGNMAPLREQLEENMKEFGSKRAELDEAFQENDWGKIRPISNELNGLKKTIAQLEKKLGITQEEHDKLMEKFTQLGASHGVTQAELDTLHRGVEDAQNSMDAALAAHADDLEAYKATSAEYRQLKRNLLNCQIKEKKAEVSDCLGKLNAALSKHRRASKSIKALCASFIEAEDTDDFDTTGECAKKLIGAQKLLDEADSVRHELADELKRIRALLADEKRALADLDSLPPPSEP